MIGTRIGNWRLDRELGTGPTGSVYVATAVDPPDDGPKVAAVKLLTHPAAFDPGFLERFPGEMLGLRRLTHPNLCKLYDCGVHAGMAYYAREPAEGTDVASLLGRCDKSADQPGMPWGKQVLSIAVQAARALKHIHHRSLLHRGLKPANLVWSPDGRLKLTDCGVGKAFFLPPLALPADPLGTAAYLAPEHFTGKPVTRRSDLYAFGGVLYTLLAGRPPFTAGTAAELMHKHCYALPDRPANFVPRLPAEFDELICDLLAKNPSRRPATAAAVLEVLDRVRAKAERKGEPVVFPPAPDDPTGSHSPLAVKAKVPAADAERRAKLLRAGGLAAALLVVVGVMLFAFFRPRPPAAELLAAALPLVESDDPANWDRAIDDYLTPMADWHPDELVSEREAARQRIQERKELRRAATAGANAKYSSDAERLYHRGLRLLQAGDAALARLTWEATATAFAGVPAEARWVSLARAGLAELDKAGRRPVPAKPDAAAAEMRKLRASGQSAAADDILKALEFLYRDQPEALAALRQP